MDALRIDLEKGYISMAEEIQNFVGGPVKITITPEKTAVIEHAGAVIEIAQGDFLVMDGNARDMQKLKKLFMKVE